MLKINQVKLPAGHSKKELETKIRKILRLSAKDELTYQITRRSIDARKKPEIYYAVGYVLTTEFPTLSPKELFQKADERKKECYQNQLK